MMKTYKYPGRKNWKNIIERPVAEEGSIDSKVRMILDDVKRGGDNAVRKYAKLYDNQDLEDFIITEEEIADAGSFLHSDFKKAIIQAKNNIETYHRSQVEEVKMVETMEGVTCWRRSVGIERVGLYIPGGTAPLFSTILMLGIPAQLAGCKEIIVCTPSVHPAILYTASLCGIKKIFRVGGAQAIAAMTYGTETIPRVFKLFGPGNQYVTTAKQLLQQEGIAIDMPAGPSELLVIADDTAIPTFVAADLLSQAEHGKDSQVMLVTISETLASDVMKELEKQITLLPRKDIAEASLKNSSVIILNSIDEAIELSDLYAPEHLILACEGAEEVALKINSAGSVFIGNYSPETAGDYASGTNHALPTNGYAAMYSGVSVDSFVKKISFQQLTKEGLQNISTTVMAMAAAEGLDAHKNAIQCRLT